MYREILAKRNKLINEIERLNIVQKSVHGEKSIELAKLREEKKKQYNFCNKLLKGMSL